MDSAGGRNGKMNSYHAPKVGEFARSLFANADGRNVKVPHMLVPTGLGGIGHS
jgi:hypothetical protein